MIDQHRAGNSLSSTLEKERGTILPLFHLAFPVKSLPETRKFYTEVLGCSVGRTDERWIDFNFGNHQITAHLKPEECRSVDANAVDGHGVPVRHFGLILVWDLWHDLAVRLAQRGIEFLIEPYIRFEGQPGEQATMFFFDPSGNALEFKSFKNPESIFSID